MSTLTFFALVVGIIGSSAFIPRYKEEQYLTDAFLRDLMEKMGKGMSDIPETYLEYPESNRLGLNGLMPGRSVKDLETEEQQPFSLDYDPLLETALLNPSIRDQEYLQHSSLWGHQYVAGGAGEGKQTLNLSTGKIKNQNIKTDAALPAYCNPPNPCPLGYSADDGCLEDFENTALFSREYQAAQDCMCDTEHMFDCPLNSARDAGADMGNELTDSDIDRIMEQFQIEDQHKSLVAKKFHSKKDHNPFLKGEKLPVAAKKGINVNY